MPRTARLRIDGLPVHIYQRGHNKDRCFFEPRDHELYIGLLGEMAQKFECRVHAYALMTNHVHLLVSAESAWAYTPMMRHLNQRYVQYINRTYRRCGSGWQGRFNASIVDSDSYLLTCYRYIELNPVRAMMVRRPGDYAWSSHGSNAYGEPSLVVTPHPLYLALGPSEKTRCAAYRALFANELTDDELERIRQASRSSRPLGCDAFLEEISVRFGVRTTKGKPGPRPKA